MTLMMMNDDDDDADDDVDSDDDVWDKRKVGRVEDAGAALNKI